MKKILSFLLALTMSLSVLSGLVIFNAIAEKPFYADYEFTQLPGIQDWGSTEMTTYNQQASVKDGAVSGTPASLVTTHLKGDAKQAIKLTMGGMPNAWTVAFSTCGNASDRAAASQIGNVLGTYSNVNVLKEYDGIRIAIENENGKEPSFNTWDKENSHIFAFRLLSADSNSWNNKSHPYATAKYYYKCKEDPSLADTIIYEDGYYYVYFKDLMDGWNSGLPFFEKYPNLNNNYANMYFWLQTGGLNNANYNGGAIYISDMQLFKEAEPLNFEELQDMIDQIECIDSEGKYADKIAAAKAVVSNPDVERSVFMEAKAGLEEVVVDLKNTVDELLNEADLCGFFDETSPYYDLAIECDLLVNTSGHTLSEYAGAILALETALNDGAMGAELYALVKAASNLWIYNYTEETYYAARKAAMHVFNNYDDNDDELLPDMQAAIDALVKVKTYKTGTGTIFDGWTTDDVNDLVDINAVKICNNIGDGLNTQGVYNAGDFSSNTIFSAGDGWFSMTAEKDFPKASIGWKSMDRDGTLAGGKNGGYPVFGDVDFASADGVRFKMEVSEGGSVGRVLIGFSNCKDLSMEIYALNLKTSAVDPNGYINVPFSYFQKAWWASTPFEGNENQTIVFIVEAYDVTEGTELKLSDMTTYSYTKNTPSATEEQINELQSYIKTFESVDLGDGQLDKSIALCETAIENDDYNECAEVIEELAPIAKGYASVKRDKAKEAINTVVAMDVTQYYINDIKSVVDTYYNAKATVDDMAKIVDICEGYIASLTPPKAPMPPAVYEVTENTITLQMASKRTQYRMGEDGEWTSGNVFGKLMADTEYTFYARIMPMGPTPASEPSEPLTVRTKKASIQGSVMIEGNAAYGNTLVASAKISLIDCGEVKYQWYRKSTITSDVEIGTGAEYTIAPEDIGNSIYVVATAEKCEGNLTSDPTAVIQKGTPVITLVPEQVVVPVGNELGCGVISGGEVSCDGVWTWLNPDLIPDVSQSGSSFTAVFTPTDTDLYNTIQADIKVVISSETSLVTITDEKTGISITGNFLVGSEDSLDLTINDILYTETAYKDMLRVGRNIGDLLLLKTITINGKLSNACVGDLTFKAYFDKNRVGDKFNLWFFEDGETRSHEVVVDSEGYITVEGYKTSYKQNNK